MLLKNFLLAKNNSVTRDISDLPHDSEIVSVEQEPYDKRMDVFTITLWSMQFEIVPENETPPFISPCFKRIDPNWIDIRSRKDYELLGFLTRIPHAHWPNVDKVLIPVRGGEILLEKIAFKEGNTVSYSLLVDSWHDVDGLDSFEEYN